MKLTLSRQLTSGEADDLECPKFDGQTQDFQNWRLNVQMWCRINKKTDEQTKVLIIHQRLSPSLQEKVDREYTKILGPVVDEMDPFRTSPINKWGM